MKHLKHAFVVLLSIINVIKPNELSQSVNTWTANPEFEGGDWDYNATNSELSQSYSHNLSAEIVMLDKQWYNADGCVSIDYTLSVIFDGHDSWHYSGLLIWNGKSASYCEWYYVGLEFHDNTHYVGLERGNAHQSLDVFTSLARTQLQFSFVDGQYYTLSIDVCNGNIFSIAIDNQLHLHYIDTGTIGNKYTTLNNGYSGYIGLSAKSEIITHAKHLSISGSRQTVARLIASTSLNCGSLSPTNYPSQEPSRTPSDTPTKPTRQPTKVPSPSPSSHPSRYTADPTPSPSDPPSGVPSKVTTIQPTVDPTDNPTFYPTENVPIQSDTVTIATIASSFVYTDINTGTIGVTKAQAIASERTLNNSTITAIVFCIISAIGLLICILVAIIMCVRDANTNDKMQISDEMDQFTSDGEDTGTSMDEMEPGKPLPKYTMEWETGCADCGKHTGLMFEVKGLLYCRECKTCYDEDDADEMCNPQPVEKYQAVVAKKISDHDVLSAITNDGKLRKHEKKERANNDSDIYGNCGSDTASDRTRCISLEKVKNRKKSKVDMNEANENENENELSSPEDEMTTTTDGNIDGNTVDGNTTFNIEMIQQGSMKATVRHKRKGSSTSVLSDDIWAK